jgi:hypothetical protein
MKRYIVKPNMWFKEKTEARLIEYLHIDGNGVKYGLFEGYREKGDHFILGAEVCSYEEFEIIDDEKTRI